MTTSNIVGQTDSPELHENARVTRIKKLKAEIQDIFAAIPGTRQFRRRVQKSVVKEAREGLQWFTSLQALDINVKQALHNRIRHYENRLAVVEEGYFEFAANMLTATFGMVGLALLILSPYVAESWFKLGTHSGDWLKLFNGSVFGVLFSMFIIAFPQRLFRRMEEKFSPGTKIALFPIWTIILLLIYWIALKLIVSKPSIFLDDIYIFLLGSVLAAIVFTGLILAILLLFMIIVIAWINYVFYRYPDYVITDRLIRILSLIERNPQRWGELQFKKELVLRLERIASHIAHDLPRQLRNEDAITDIWFADLAIKSAAAMRSLKKWVITPKPDTRDQLIARLARSLTLAATGNWDGLEQAQPEIPPGARRPWFHRLASLLGRLLSAFSLLILSWVLPYTPLALEQPLAGYLTLVGIGVAVFGITTMLDPSWVDKLNALKEFMGLLPFTGRNK